VFAVSHSLRWSHLKTMTSRYTRYRQDRLSRAPRNAIVTVGTFTLFELDFRNCVRSSTSLIRRLFTDFIDSSRYTDISHPNSTMKATHCILIALSLCAVASSTTGCKYAVESYTTTDAMIVTEAAFIAQVSAECEDSPSNLYAEVEGRLLVAANAGPNKYQVCYLFTIQLRYFACSFIII